ncbi:unnamed protein product [Thlaspi arvense]|uniref:Uncharacterized protein n=1 Tax=Thlaspi arvense TaxID=13288 RepID=A0AAU9T4F8_THLAR|nr:unnamed protein product [Thlaspi arvense]
MNRASNIITKLTFEGESPSFSDVEKPETAGVDENLGKSPADLELQFCQVCAHHCMHKNKNVF